MKFFSVSHSTLFLIFGVLSLCAIGSAWAVSAKKTTTQKTSIVCWTDASGQKSCGNSLPANLAGAAHEKIGTDGIVRGQVAAAATPEEIAAQQQAQQQAAAAALATAAQKQQDSFIHDRYPSRTDIAKEFDQQRTSKKASLDLMVSADLPLRKTLVQRLRQAGRLEEEHKKIPSNLDRLIEEARTEILSGEKNLAAQKAELAALDNQQAATEAAWDRAEGGRTPSVVAAGPTAAAPATVPSSVQP